MLRGRNVAEAILPPTRRKWRLFRCDGIWHVASPRLAILRFDSWERAAKYLVDRLSEKRRVVMSLFGELQ